MCVCELTDFISYFKSISMPGLMVHSCNHSTQEVEAGGLKVGSLAWASLRDPALKKKKISNKKINK